MEWKHVVVLFCGAGVAVTGAMLKSEALIGLGSTIVGGVIGVLVPHRQQPAPVSALLPSSVDSGPKRPL